MHASYHFIKSRSLQIINNASIAGDLSLSGNANITGSLTTIGALVVQDTTNSTSPSTGSLIVQGGAGINGTLFAGNVNSLGSVTANTLSGILTTPEQINVTSLGTLTGLTSNGQVIVSSTTISNSITSGALVVNGGIGVGGSTNLHDVTIYSTHNSTNTTNGSLIVKGGVGIQKQLHVGMGIDVHMTRIVNLLTPIDKYDAVNKKYVDALIQTTITDKPVLHPIEAPVQTISTVPLILQSIEIIDKGTYTYELSVTFKATHRINLMLQSLSLGILEKMSEKVGYNNELTWYTKGIIIITDSGDTLIVTMNSARNGFLSQVVSGNLSLTRISEAVASQYLVETKVVSTTSKDSLITYSVWEPELPEVGIYHVQYQVKYESQNIINLSLYSNGIFQDQYIDKTTSRESKKAYLSFQHVKTTINQSNPIVTLMFTNIGLPVTTSTVTGVFAQVVKIV